jgi:threonyl-tRNA synthetase
LIYLLFSSNKKDDAMLMTNTCNTLKSITTLFISRFPTFVYRFHRLQTRSFSISFTAHKSWQKIQQKYMAESETRTVLTELNPPPDYINHRIKIWEELKAKYQAHIASQPQVDITITLPDGKTLPGKAWKTTPNEIAMGISQGLAAATVIAKVNGELWDLDRPFEKDSSLQLIKFDDEQGKQVFWHSTAHIMGEAMELNYGGCLCYGPPIEQGFYYDMYLENRTVSGFDYEPLEKTMKRIVKEEQPFERLEISKDDLERLFGYNPFKVRILNEKVHTPTTTVYRCGPLIDLCRGPHIRHTGKVKAFAITKNSSTYWEGDQSRESLQRIYGISFPDPKQLKEWKFLQEEAAKRNHRKIGIEQDLFFFHELSPGSCFFYPKGAHIYNKLIEFIRGEYRKRGYQEVISPNIYNSKLWMTSGHWDHYSENMFKIEIEKETFALKPMNCPGHCLMFKSRLRSWRELPLRMADFGVLHRNEASGALSGLTRVRRFQQDDAHIFCTQSQIKEEIQGCLDFLKHVYGIFGFTFELKLSTRPEKFLGEIDTWNQAESQLEQALKSFGSPWKVDPGDGAFYGPKIDITIRDALQRAHQCATIQLDFQLPQRFQLEFQTDEQGQLQSPVIIHRAMLGSLERMIAILTESFGGKWPFWLSPRQMAIVPVFPSLDSYAQEIQKKFWLAGFQVDCDLDPGTTLNKKIRQNQLAQYNFIGVVGQQEQTNGTINIRTRDNKQHGEFPIDEVIRRFKELADTRTNHAEDEFAGSSVDSNVAGATSKLEATTISQSHDEQE